MDHWCLAAWSLIGLGVGAALMRAVLTVSGG